MGKDVNKELQEIVDRTLAVKRKLSAEAKAGKIPEELLDILLAVFVFEVNGAFEFEQIPFNKVIGIMKAAKMTTQIGTKKSDSEEEKFQTFKRLVMLGFAKVGDEFEKERGQKIKYFAFCDDVEYTIAERISGEDELKVGTGLTEEDARKNPTTRAGAMIYIEDYEKASVFMSAKLDPKKDVEKIFYSRNIGCSQLETPLEIFDKGDPSFWYGVLRNKEKLEETGDLKTLELAAVEIMEDIPEILKKAVIKKAIEEITKELLGEDEQE